MVIIQEGGGEEEEMRGLSGERSNEWMNEWKLLLCGGGRVWKLRKT